MLISPSEKVYMLSELRSVYTVAASRRRDQLEKKKKKKGDINAIKMTCLVTDEIIIDLIKSDFKCLT